MTSSSTGPTLAACPQRTGSFDRISRFGMESALACSDSRMFRFVWYASHLWAPCRMMTVPE